jgi:hypothetical protein
MPALTSTLEHPATRLVLTGAAVAVALALLWLPTARLLSLLVDQLFTVALGGAPASPVGWDGVNLRFFAATSNVGPPAASPDGIGSEAASLTLEGPAPGYTQVATVTVGADHRLALSTRGRSLMLGAAAGTLVDPGSTPPVSIPVFAAEPGDVVSLSFQRSWLSWPVFELNFMTGRSPSWRRSCYCHLTWKKRSGQRLDLLWRYEQGFYAGEGWGACGETGGASGLIRTELTPSP